MSNDARTIQIAFQPLGRQGTFTAGITLIEAARQLGVGLRGVCGGLGFCGTCRVVVPPESRVALSPVTAGELERLGPVEIERGVRMACHARALDSLHVVVPPGSLTTTQRTQVEGLETPVEIEPPVIPRDLALDAAHIHDLRSDVRRLLDGLGAPVQIDLAVMQTLPEQLRGDGWRVRAALRDGRMVALLRHGAALLGLAVDLGSTKLAGYLIDLETGETLASAGEMNPQLAYGEDVMARITYAMHEPGGTQRLQETVAGGIQELTERLCLQAGTSCTQVVEAVVVGNTAMHHLFLGLPTAPLGLAPYVAVQSAAMDVRARDVGLRLAAGAQVHLLPNVAGFVGADHVSAVLAARMDEASEVTVLLDIGTNTEICLAANGRLRSCSTASGPAFEGAHIRYGMRAAPGAIERVRIIDDRVLWETVDDQPPVGICGSGILDAVAEMRRAGVLDRLGRMRDVPGVRRGERGTEFVLVPADETGLGEEITVSRKDVNEIQLAKAAMAAGWQVLLEEAGLSEADVERVIVAGAFGTYIDAGQAIAIGMLPAVRPDRVAQVGNVAGTGARMALVSRAERTRAEQVAGRIDYVELTVHPSFRERFARALELGRDQA